MAYISDIAGILTDRLARFREGFITEFVLREACDSLGIEIEARDLKP
jgi:hypothetical protein